MIIDRELVIRPDCELWNGYRPCLVQMETGLPDCAGCSAYQPENSMVSIASKEPYSPEKLAESERVGIIEMGGLGSILRATVVSGAIREANPDANLVWFTHSRGAQLLKYVPGVAPIDIDREDVSKQLELVRNLDVVINFELNDAVKPHVRLAKCVGGFALNAQDRFHGVMPYAQDLQRLQIDNEYRAHQEATTQQLLLRSVGLECSKAYDINLTGDNVQRARDLLEASFIAPQSSIVGLNIGTSEKGKVRRWPVENFALLARDIAESNPDVGVAILGGPEDEEVYKEIQEMLSTDRHPNIAILPNNIEVGDFIALISQLDVVVTADTFAFHAARSQATPVVGLVGPVPPQELNASEPDRIIGPKLPCAPCYGRCSRKVLSLCMKKITVTEVGEEVMLKLTGKVLVPIV